MEEYLGRPPAGVDPDELRKTFLAQLDALDLSEKDLAALPPKERAILEEIVGIQQEIYNTYRAQGFDQYEPQDHQLPFHSSQASNRWFIGANKMGKSRALHQEIKWFALRNHPYRDVGAPGPIWACSPSDEKSENYQQPMLEQVIGSSQILKKWRSPRPNWLLKNGQRIHFKNYSQDVATFSSDEIRAIAYDEEPPWDIFEEGWMRRSAEFKLDIFGTCTPTKGLTWIWPKIIDRTEANHELLPDTEWFGGNIFMNKYLSEEFKQQFTKGITGVMYRIRVMGEVLPIGGSMVFPPDVLLEWRARATPPLLQMEMDRLGTWVQNENGPLWLWELPKKGHEYVIGCDPAEGKNTSHDDAEPDHDQTSISIFDRHSRRYVAEYTSGKIRPDECGEWVLPALSTWFNGAKTIIERNNHGHAVIALARKKMPGRLYRAIDDRTDVAVHPDEGYGYLTTKPSRDYAVDMMLKAVAQRSVTVMSQPAIRQFMSFVLKSNGKREHQDGSKDDRVISHALCQVFDLDLPRVIRIVDTSEKAGMRAFAMREKPKARSSWYRRYGQAA